MTIQTIALVIGISQYSHTDLPFLPAAQSDAVHFARSLRNWGICESTISLLLNTEATKASIESFFSNLSKVEDPYKFIFYFCGHGHREMSPAPASYLLCHDSSIKNAKCINGINLDFIVKQISQLNILESYIFIDACYLRINTLFNPRLDEEIRGGKLSNKSLFCLLSSGTESSFESLQGGYGYFTEALLRSLSQLSKVEGSPTELIHAINKEMHAQQLPLPEMYHIGNQKLSFIPSLSSPITHKGLVQRRELISTIQDKLIQKRTKILCLTGEQGIGKSIICRELSSEKLKTLYIAFPESMETSFEPTLYLAKVIQERVNIQYDLLSSETYLSQFSSHFPYYLLVLDQVERLNPHQIHSLIQAVSDLKVRCIFASTQSLSGLVDEQFRDFLEEIELPPFSFSEGLQLIKKINSEYSEKECQLIHLVSQGNPLKMKKISLFFSKIILEESLEFEQELKKAIAALCSCGLYINEHLFASTFKLQEKMLTFLREMGLIMPSEIGYAPHDLLHEIAEIEDFPIDTQATLNYWYHQSYELPTHILTARHLILTIRALGYEEQADPYLKAAFQTLFQTKREHLHDLVEAAQIFLQVPTLTEASVFLAEILVEWGHLELAQQLLEKPTDSKQLEERAQLCEIRRLWQTPHILQAISLISSILEKASDLSYQMRCYFYRGISYFLNGNWDNASADFQYVLENAQERRILGRAQCMQGTIMGLRGSDIQKGRIYLEEGTLLLMKLKDPSGAWAGWNNLGEILWKSGDYKTSAVFLEKALELAKTLHHEEAKLESLRNHLQLYLRAHGPFSKEVSGVLLAIEKFDWQQASFFEKAQILNTVASAYLFRKNISQAVNYLKKAIPYTARNPELFIYTLANLAFLAKILGKYTQCDRFFNRAITCAEKVENRLAVHQIKNDFILCFKENSR